MVSKKTSETVTENLFRDFYGSKLFIEKTQFLPAMDLYQKKGLPVALDILISSVTLTIIVL